MQYVFDRPDEASFIKHSLEGRIIQEGDESNPQFVHIKCPETGHVTTIRQNEVDFRYYVIAGEGEFQIEDVPYSVKPGDLVHIPKGIKFTYIGELEMLLITTPAWYESQEDIIS